MKAKQGRKAIFIIELTMLFVMLILVITVITEVLVMSRSRSIEASRLNASVILAASAAEKASVSHTMQDLSDALADMENTAGHKSRLIESDDGGIVWFIASTNAGDEKVHRFMVRVTRAYSDEGRYASDTVDVFNAVGSEDVDSADTEDEGKLVYSLESGTYFGKEAKL